MEADEKEEQLYTFGVEDLLLTKEQKDELTSNYVNIIDSNGNYLGNVEIYIISPYEKE
jgi:hypothetical protein